MLANNNPLVIKMKGQSETHIHLNNTSINEQYTFW